MKSSMMHAILTATALATMALDGGALQAQDAANVAPADPAAAKAAAKAREKQLAEWKQTYGAGPYPDEIDAYLANKPEALKPLYKTLFTGGERNAVLNFERLGLAAIETGHWDDAERAFDAALLRIEAIYAKNPQAEAARSAFHKEANKAFKGEPYERAMAYYYRGMLYLRKGDFENARASFRTAEYQDTVSEAEEYQGDFALMDYLAGWASQCNGQAGMAKDFYEAAIAAQTSTTPGTAPASSAIPAATAPAAGEDPKATTFKAPAADANVLMVAEMGFGPLKAKDGRQKEKLVFNTATTFPEIAASFTVQPKQGATQVIGTMPISSVRQQATTRGGRAIDGVLAGKASFKSTTQAVGTVATTAGLTMMASGDSNSAQTGGYMAMAGMLFSAFSTAVKTDADVRMWDTLPDTISLATSKMDTSGGLASVAFTDGKAPLDLGSPAVRHMAGPRCTLIWARSRSVLKAGTETPGDDTNVAKSVSRKKNVQEADARFRSALMAS